MTSERGPVAIIGAGTMGYQISIQLASAGRRVRLHDRDPQALERGMTRISEIVPALIEDGTISATIEHILERITPSSTLPEAIDGAWLVIEAIPEQRTIKESLFRELSELVEEDVILATNSSSFRSRLLVESTTHPRRLMNTHFYNFPWERSGVEIMTCGQTDPELMQQVYEYFEGSGFVPVMVSGESTGFVYNRIWRAIKKESLTVLDEELASPEDIDRLYCLATGSRKGPFALMDQVGLDVVLDIERHYHAESGDPRDQPPTFLEQMVKEKRLGRKTGQGFYTYPNPPFELPGWPRERDQVVKYSTPVVEDSGE